MATITDMVRASEARIASAQVAALTRLDREPRSDAVFTTDKFLVLDLIKAIAGRGRRCPKGLVIAGVDDVSWAEAFRPRLTVVAQPAERMGREAVALLFDRTIRMSTGASVDG